MVPAEGPRTFRLVPIRNGRARGEGIVEKGAEKGVDSAVTVSLPVAAKPAATGIFLAASGRTVPGRCGSLDR